MKFESDRFRVLSVLTVIFRLKLKANLRKFRSETARVSTQIIARDYHAYFMQSLALIASVIEQFATEIRHLQKTEVLELEEGFGKGQKDA